MIRQVWDFIQFSRQSRWLTSWLASAQARLAKLRRRFTVDLWRTLAKKDRRRRNFIPQLESLEVRLVPSSWLVTNTSNSASTSGSLPWAVAQANTDSGDSITFAGSLSGDTITLAGVLTLSSNVTITGLGASNLAISGNNSVEVFKIDSAVTASISCLTIEKGYIAGSGGGIQNAGVLTLSNDIITGNTQTTGSSGGGIFNATGGTLTLTNSTVTGNSAMFAGGLGNDGVANVVNTTISNNTAYHRRAA